MVLTVAALATLGAQQQSRSTGPATGPGGKPPDTVFLEELTWAETRDLIDGFRTACTEGSVAEGLATLYAYESQAPAVATQKILGLQKNYAFVDPRGYEFFSVHREVDVYHSQSERDVIAAAAATPEARLGLEEATRSAADRLWRFLDGAYAGTC